MELSAEEINLLEDKSKNWKRGRRLVKLIQGKFWKPWNKEQIISKLLESKNNKKKCSQFL